MEDGRKPLTSDPLIKPFRTLVYVAFGFACLIVGLYFWRFWGPLTSDQATWGQFGDYIGGVLNPFFAALALIGLLITVFLQSRELQMSTEEFKKSADALYAQNASLALQNFEGTFFQLLRLQTELANSLESRDQNNQVTHSGRSCFRIYYEARFREYFKKPPQGKDPASIERIRGAWEQLYAQRQAELGNYFRHLYHVVLFAKEKAPTEPYRYVRFIRAQLSTYELALLFYNCLTTHGDKFKPLVEEFALLHNMDLGVLCMNEHINLYSPAAFGHQDHDAI